MDELDGGNIDWEPALDTPVIAVFSPTGNCLARANEDTVRLVFPWRGYSESACGNYRGKAREGRA